MQRPLPPGQRICVVLLSGIGDVVNGLPVVNALKRHDPEGRITWIVESVPAPILTDHPSVDERIRFDRTRGLREVLRLRRELRTHEFDLVLNMNVYFKSVIPTFFARAPDVVALGRDRARDLVWLFANHHLPPRPPAHRVDMYLEFIEYLGLPREPVEWRLAPTEKELVEQREFFRTLRDRPVVGLVPTSGRPEKDWPTERWARLATSLVQDFGFHVLLLGGPGEREIERARELERRSPDGTVWALGDDLRRLIYLVDGADLLIAGDTGPLHIARARDTPVIGLYAHTDPRIHGPYRAPTDLLIDRHNQEADGTPVSAPERGWGPDRMNLIRVADVLEKVQLARERDPRFGDRRSAINPR